MSKQKKTKNVSIEALKTTLAKKKECTAKAQVIVEEWIEGVITEDDLVKNLHFINQDHFQDVIEERAILKNCGYPLCANQLKNIPSKQYQISTQLNKVFDITERKLFCSNLCYKAAKYLKDQLLSSPLWLRNDKDIVHFKLLSLDKTQGSSGIEVDMGHSRVKLEPESEGFTSVLKYTTDSLTKLSANVDKFEEKYEKNDSDNTIKLNQDKDASVKENQDKLGKSDSQIYKNSDNIVNLNLDSLHTESNSILFYEETVKINKDEVREFDNQNSQENTIVKKSSNHINKETEYCKTIVDNRPLISNEKEKQDVEEVNKLDKESCSTELCEQFNNSKTEICESQSVKTKFKKEKEIQKIDSKDKNKRKDSHKKKKTKAVEENHTMVNAVMHIEQCLMEWCTIDTLCYVFGEEKVKEMLKEKGESIKKYQTIGGGAPVDPHLYERYLMICRKLNVLELEDSKYDAALKDELKGPQKPLPDYTALKEEAENLELKVRSFYQGDKTVTFKENTSVVEENEKSSVLPLVDLHAQKALRRRIVLDRLSRVLSDLGQTLGLKHCYLTQDIRLLISTFNLSANNVTFKPVEWNLIALVIFKLLSIRNQLLSQTLSSETSRKNLTLLLLSYQLDGGYLDRLAIWLTDIDYVLRKKS